MLSDYFCYEKFNKLNNGNLMKINKLKNEKSLTGLLNEELLYG